jgi:hypothetical protein
MGPIENLGKYPFTEEIGLIFAARRMVRNIKPHLQDIADRYAIAFHGRAENGLRVLWNSHEHICLAAGRF